MKKTILSTALALLSLVSASAQNANESVVTAIIKGIPDGTELQAKLAATHRDEKPLATGVVKNGKWTVTIPMTEARMIGVGPKDSPFTFTYMTKGGENVQVSLSAKDYGDGTNQGYYSDEVKVSGSAMNDEYTSKIGAVMKSLDKLYVDYHKDGKVINDKIDAAWKTKDSTLVKQLKATEEYKKFEEAEGNFFKTVEATYNKLYADNKDSWWGPFAMLNTMSYFTKDNKKEWAMFSDAAKNSFYGQCLNEQINPKTFEGEALPQFDLQQTDGSKVSMASCVEGKKYYLVDFWASWCGPCRKEIPNLKKLYELYKDKGLQIVSVSIDQKEDAWKKALNEEKLPWPNGLDRADIATAYKVRFIPAIFLVDGATGKCIAENIRGAELAIKLAELFK